MASGCSKALMVLGILFLAGVLLLAGLVALVVVGDNEAKEKANALCGTTEIGSSADVALQRAKQSGSATSDPRWIGEPDGEQDLIVAFPANLPLTGYMCSISARDGKVTRVEIYTVD